VKRRTAWILVAGVAALALGAAGVGALALVLRGGAKATVFGKDKDAYLALDLSGEIPEQAAGDQLVTNVGAATNIDALKQARLDFVSALTGGLTGNGGLLGDLLKQTTGTVTTLLGSTLDAVAKLTADLDATLKADLAAMVKANICVDIEASAKLDVTLYPNPISLNRTGIQLRLRGNASVYRGTILDILGRKVGDFDVPASGRVIWDGKDEAGRMVKPGVYLIHVEAGGSSATVRVAVLR